MFVAPTWMRAKIQGRGERTEKETQFRIISRPMSMGIIFSRRLSRETGCGEEAEVITACVGDLPCPRCISTVSSGC